MKRFEVTSFPTAEALAEAVALAWVDLMVAANREGGRHGVALSGGRIAQPLYSSVADQIVSRQLSLDGMHFFWADERCVPPDDPESNFRIAREKLFEPMKVPGEQVHRIRGEDPPEDAAQSAEEEIRRVMPMGPNRQPQLDLVILGMGEDGHVASLFPNEREALVLSPRVYRAIHHSPKPPQSRVTLGYAPIATAKQVWVLIAGSGKEAALHQSLADSGQTPLARVLRLRSQTRVFAAVASH